MFNPHIPPPPMETILPVGGTVHPLLLFPGPPSMVQCHGVQQPSQMFYMNGQWFTIFPNTQGKCATSV